MLFSHWCLLFLQIVWLHFICLNKFDQTWSNLIKLDENHGTNWPHPFTSLWVTTFCFQPWKRYFSILMYTDFLLVCFLFLSQFSLSWLLACLKHMSFFWTVSRFNSRCLHLCTVETMAVAAEPMGRLFQGNILPVKNRRCKTCSELCGFFSQTIFMKQMDKEALQKTQYCISRNKPCTNRKWFTEGSRPKYIQTSVGPTKP